MNKMANSLNHSFLIKDWRSDTGDQTAGLEMALLEHGHTCIIRLRC